MEGCSEPSAGAVATLPDDILVEILSRVSSKSVCRCKCVSKAWRDLIADPDRCKKLCQSMQGLFFMTLEKGHSGFGLMTTGSSVTLDVDPGFSFLMERLGNHKLVLLDCCNGLLLFGHEREPPYCEEASGYVVCNPTTKQWQAVPRCGSPLGVNYVYLATYLAFDPAVSSHFHLVQFRKTGMYLEFMSVHAYSSKTGTWSHHKNSEEEKEEGHLEGWWNHAHLSMSNRCAFVNGFLHLILRGSSVRHSNEQQIVVVDVQGRARRMIELPNVLGWARCNGCIYFGQSQGYLHCITKESLDFQEKRYKLSIWVLQDYDAQEQEWVLKDTVNPLQLFGEKCQRNGIIDCEVADMHLNCNVVFFFSPCEHKFIAYNMDRKDVSVFGATSKCVSRLKVGRYIPCFSELITGASPISTESEYELISTWLNCINLK